MGGLSSREVRERGRLTRLADVACTLGRRDRPYAERHDGGTFTVALVRRGAFRYRAADTNRMHSLRAGWLLVGRAGAEFECSHEHDGGDDCASLTLSESVLWDVAREAGIAPRVILSAAPALPPLARVAALVERARRDASGDLDELGHEVVRAVVEHAAETRLAPAAPSPAQRRRVEAAIDRIEAHCREPLTLAELAASVDLSPFHFLRVFHAIAGATPHQYVIGARIRLAVRMLLDTDRPITEIAYGVGFQDLSNFIRTFRRATGASPRAYRTR